MDNFTIIYYSIPSDDKGNTWLLWAFDQLQPVITSYDQLSPVKVRLRLQEIARNL
jgi:hypothetical protein